MEELGQKVDEQFKAFKETLDQLEPEVAARIAEELHNRYRSRSDSDGVQFSYEVPDADYVNVKARKEIERRLREETGLEVSLLGSSSAKHVDLMYHARTDETTDVQLTIPKKSDTEGKRILLFNFWRQNLTRKYVEDNYQKLINTIHSIVVEEGKKYQPITSSPS